jgi:phenylacetate-CoA ligase
MDARMSDPVRFPTLTAQGRQMLAFLRDHPAAPVYRNHSGNKLVAGELDALRAFEAGVAGATVGWVPGTRPDWLAGFVNETYATVPHYRRLGSPPLRFDAIAPVCRADFAEDIAAFVPDHVDTNRMISFRTSGTTGHPIFVPSHPVVAGRYLAFHKRALRRYGIDPAYGAGQVGIVLLGYQQRCFTYVSVTPTMNESGLAKINLHPDDWRDPDDRARYLDALAPEIVAGDPVSFAAYLALPVTWRPRALISVSMMLLPGLRAQLEARFGCPVLDIYSLNEVGPVGVFDAAAGGHVLLQPRLFVEILDAAGVPVAPGERGEVTVTGGFNFCLPLLRYRTGDYASLASGPDAPVLVGLSGRRPIRFLAQGVWLNNVDITHALQDAPVAHFQLHQHADGAVTLFLPRAALHLADPMRDRLNQLFGAGMVRVAPLDASDKVVQYSSDLAGAQE